jgi:hypothetical protein
MILNREEFCIAHLARIFILKISAIDDWKTLSCEWSFGTVRMSIPVGSPDIGCHISDENLYVHFCVRSARILF